MAEEAWSFGSGALWPLRLVSICELGHRGPRGLPQEEVQPGFGGGGCWAIWSGVREHVREMGADVERAGVGRG